MAKTPAVIIVDKDTPTQTAGVNVSGQVAIQDQPNMDVAASTLATAANQATIIGYVDGLEALLTSLDGKDFATETTLAAQLDITLSALRDALRGIGDKTLTDLETTLDAVLAFLNAEDFASETTSAAILSQLNITLSALRDAIVGTGPKTLTDINTTQTDGTQKAIVRGGAKGTTVPADVTSYDISADRQALDVHNWGLGTGNSQQVEGLAAEGDAIVGNPVWVAGYDGTYIRGLRTILDGALYRLQAEAKVARGASDLVHLDAIDTDSGQGRLMATLYSPDGDPVSFPSVSSSIKNDFVRAAGSDDLLVDGSVTPVVFEYLADATYDISLQEIKFTLVSNSINFGSGYFGAVVAGLTNGVLVRVISNGVTIDVYNLIENESFVNFSSPGGFEWVVSAKDLLASNYVIGGGLKLHAGTGDKVMVTVRDNISSAGVYFKCFVKGNLLGA